MHCFSADFLPRKKSICLAAMPCVCPGTSAGQPCIFGAGGGAGWLQQGRERCTWYDPPRLLEVSTSKFGKGPLRRAFFNLTESAVAEAHRRLSEEARPFFTEEEWKAKQRAREEADEEQPASRKRPASAMPADEGEEAQPAGPDNEDAMPALKRPASALADGAAQAAGFPIADPPAVPIHAENLAVNLAVASDLNEAEQILQNHAGAVLPTLNPHWIAGDGNCLYRAAARQTTAGEANYLKLRQDSVAAAASQTAHYAQYFHGEDPQQEVLSWAGRMQQDRFWGDHISCRTLTDFLNRPMIIWRKAAPNQPPSCFVPELGYTALHNVEPIYLCLEEEVRGSEHYTALLPAALAIPAAPAPEAHPENEEEPEKESQAPKPPPAERRGLHGLEAIGDWGKLGLIRAECQTLLDLPVALTPLEAKCRLQQSIPTSSSPAST